MKVIDTKIPDVKIIEPAVFGDERGFFMETWQQKKFEEFVAKRPTTFVQDNHSKSQKGVLRGLHFQLERPQGKLVRVSSGSILDVAVDIRQGSDTFGQWVSVELNSENRRQLWIPEGFAHGFLTLSETAECLYKTTDYYFPEYEKIIIWNDKNLEIEWGESSPLLSDKDKKGLLFRELFCVK